MNADADILNFENDDESFEEILLRLQRDKDIDGCVRFLERIRSEGSSKNRIRNSYRSLFPLIPQESILFQRHLLDIIENLGCRESLIALITVWDRIPVSFRKQVFYNRLEFWNGLRNGLCTDNNDDYTYLKIALYLLKQALRSADEEAGVSNVAINGWKRKQAWREFVLLAETLDEKQVHIIKPVLDTKWNSFSRSIDFSDKNDPDRIDVSWYFALYRLLFSHCNSAIVSWGVTRFLNELTDDYSLHKNPDRYSEFCSHYLLNALNDTKLCCKIGVDRLLSDLTGFFQRLRTQIPDFPEFILLSVYKIGGWGPIPLFLVVKSIKDSCDDAVTLTELWFDITEDFLRTKLACHEPFIRNAIEDDLLDIAFKSKFRFTDDLPCLIRFAEFCASREYRRNRFTTWIRRNGDIMSHDVMTDSNSPLGYAVYLSAVCLETIELKAQIVSRIVNPIIETMNRPYASSCEYHISVLSHLITMTSDTITPILNPFRDRLVSVVMNRVSDMSDIRDEDALKSLERYLSILRYFRVVDYPTSCTKNPFILLKLALNARKSIESSDSILSVVVSEWTSNGFPHSLFTKNRRMDDEYLSNQWRVLRLYDIKGIVTPITAVESLRSGGRNVVIPVIEWIIYFLNNDGNDRDDEYVVDTFIPACQETLIFYRKNRIFRSGMNLLMDVALHPRLVERFPSRIADFCLEILRHSESVSGLAPMLMKRLLQVDSSCRKLEFVPVLAQVLTYGPIFRKDQKFLAEINSFIRRRGYPSHIDVRNDDDDDDLFVGNKVNGFVRLAGLEITLRNPELFPDIIRTLAEIDLRVTGNKTRYFSNSLIHLIRHRIRQIILVLVPGLSSSTASALLETLLKTDIGGQQRQQLIDIRYLTEWIVIALIKCHGGLSVLERHYLEQIRDSKSGSCIPSFITIFASVLEPEDALTKITPWLMGGQTYVIRITAAIQFRHLMSKLSEPINEKWKFISKSLSEVMLSSLSLSQESKIERDIRLWCVDVFLRNFNFRRIFRDFPRFMGISEWIDESQLKIVTTISTLPDSFFDLSFVPENETKLEMESVKVDSKETTETELLEEKINVQKKIIPINDNEYDDFRDSKMRSPSCRDLTIVTSLIDRLPNLGGLCRSSEIFGVGTFVIGNLKFTEDSEFRSVSVTAQNWIHRIEEVKPCDLRPYLDGLRIRDGYTIVGVEQTEESVSLYDYRFHDKTVLVLGNEKGGIPANLLPALDVCIEIPQSGVIRSFNVHVTGALVMGEYVRQKREREK